MVIMNNMKYNVIQLDYWILIDLKLIKNEKDDMFLVWDCKLLLLIKFSMKSKNVISHKEKLPLWVRKLTQTKEKYLIRKVLPALTLTLINTISKLFKFHQFKWEDLYEFYLMKDKILKKSVSTKLVSAPPLQRGSLAFFSFVGWWHYYVSWYMLEVFALLLLLLYI